MTSQSRSIRRFLKGARPRYIAAFSRSRLYSAAMRIPLLRGRYFREDERLDRTHVAIIDQLAAQQYFSCEDPIGRHLKPIEDNDSKLYEIVGVVGKTRSYGLPAANAHFLPSITQWRKLRRAHRARQRQYRCRIARPAHPEDLRSARSRSPRIRRSHHAAADRRCHPAGPVQFLPRSWLRHHRTHARSRGPLWCALRSS